jgi:CRP/FNR family cyclic AMP-dependent transcriptional regulator
VRARWVGAVHGPDSDVSRGRSLLVDLDPELLDAVPWPDRALVQRLRVTRLDVGRGTWRPPASPSGAFVGLLVADGIAFRSIAAAGFATGDLVGAGDVIPARTPAPALPWGGEAEVAWHVLAPLSACVLDTRFIARTARWPAITARLLERHAEHTDRLMTRLSLVHRQRVEERVLLVLWDLAERWGKVTPDGVLLPVPLRHHQLAALAASLRPSVTLALRRLAARGIVERCVRGYLLHGSLQEGWAALTSESQRESASG